MDEFWATFFNGCSAIDFLRQRVLAQAIFYRISVSFGAFSFYMVKNIILLSCNERSVLDAQMQSTKEYINLFLKRDSAE